MPTFVMFGKYSADAMKSASRERTKQAVEVIRKFGGQIKAGYALLGKTDLLVIADFPGTDEAMKASMSLTRLTGVGFATSPAIAIEELDKLISEI